MNLDIADDFLSSLPARCQEYVLAASLGDPEAATSLMCSAPNEDRGDIVSAFYELSVPTDVFRVALTSAWDHDHTSLFDAVGRDPRKLNKFFRHADFETDHLPSKFTIYRGGYGDLSEQSYGISWTRNRDCACWFAMRVNAPTKPPIVLKREVMRRSVLAHINTRKEDEIVVAGVSHAFVDGDAADWQQGYERYETQKQEEQAA
jgi:hypothetical protein